MPRPEDAAAEAPLRPERGVRSFSSFIRIILARNPEPGVHMDKETPQPPMRRSSRVNVRIPVTISGTLGDNTPFVEDTTILSISKYGAKVQTRLPLTMGMKLKVQPKQHDESGLFRVVWVGRQGTPREGEVGIEYVRVSNLLGVTFPE
ncbi:MAG: PilZ domain-containing protein [Acidobacteriia bacterium]|nr:PilZ domain-containing protein [Terriglobia bacterium]